MTEERQAQLLAQWLDSHAEGEVRGEPPPDLDPEVVEAICALRPDRAPPARVDVDAILADVKEGPLAERGVSAENVVSLEAARLARQPDAHEQDAAALAAWLDGEGSADDMDPEVAEAIGVLRPDLAPPPRVSIDDILDSVTEGPFARTPAAEAGAGEVVSLGRERRRRVPWWALPGVGVLAVAATTLVLVVPGAFLYMRASDSPFEHPGASVSSPAAPTVVAQEEAVSEDADGRDPAPRPTTTSETTARATAATDTGLRQQAQQAIPEVATRSDAVIGGEGDALSATRSLDRTVAATAGEEQSRGPAPDVADIATASGKAGQGRVGGGYLEDAPGDAPVALLGAEPVPEEAAPKSAPAREAPAPDLTDDLEAEEPVLAFDEGGRSRRNEERKRDKAAAEVDESWDGDLEAAPATAERATKKKSGRPPAAAGSSAPQGESVAEEAPSAGPALDRLDDLRARAWPIDRLPDLGARYPEVASVLAQVEQATAAGDPTTAMALLESLLDHPDPEVVQDAAFKLGQRLLQAGRLDTALVIVRRGLSVTGGSAPRRARLLALRGEILERKHDPEAAIDAYEQAIDAY